MFLKRKKKNKKLEKTTQNKPKEKVNFAKIIGALCFAYFAFASLIALFPHKGAWYWKGSQ